MKIGSLSRRRLTLLGGLAAASLAALAVVSVAYGTGPFGTATTTTLADGTSVNTINAHAGPIKLQTRDSVEVFQTSSTAQPAWSSGWHVHTGPIIVNITAGTMTFYQPAMSGNHVKRGEGHNSCTTTTVSAGHTFLETPGTPVEARNEGTVAVSWLTTQIIPVGASKRVDSTSSFCGVP
jgi:hypothetical protein